MKFNGPKKNSQTQDTQTKKPTIKNWQIEMLGNKDVVLDICGKSLGMLGNYRMKKKIKIIRRTSFSRHQWRMTNKGTDSSESSLKFTQIKRIVVAFYVEQLYSNHKSFPPNDITFFKARESLHENLSMPTNKNKQLRVLHPFTLWKHEALYPPLKSFWKKDFVLDRSAYSFS